VYTAAVVRLVDSLFALLLAACAVACGPRGSPRTGPALAGSVPAPPAASADDDGHRIENVIFDFGDVLLTLHHEEFAAAMTGIVGSLDDPGYRSLMWRFEKGELTADAFRQALRAFRPENRTLSDAAIDAALNSMIGDVDCKKVKLIQRLRQARYHTFALSTTNVIHVALIRRRFAACLPPGTPDPMAALFDKAYFTQELGEHKPEVAVYRALLADARIDPRRTLFLDDSADNVLGAQRAGIYALVVPRNPDLGWLEGLLGHVPGTKPPF
jgi:putative hydrolase of the HAD superfamily